ncbi:MAG: hypothetical protein K2P78_03230, partial [Gemmataceae bacterium]|nr:hypothetical protein [Gemmataceae bacterium]
MSARQRLRSLLLRPFRTRPAAPIRNAPRPVGRRIEELEDRVTPAFSEFVDPNPAAGNQFGLVVVPLSTGNVVVSAPGDDAGGTDAGAVYLFNGSTGALISTLTGSRANDRVGESVRALANGNFIVASSQWDNGAVVDAGAVTFGSGTTGVSGVVSAANSLVGTTANDRVGFAALTLATGNYVVFSKQWDNGGLVDAGAATFGNGATGTVGPVSAANSLVGSRAGDGVGDATRSIVLTNGNYVVASPAWDNGSVVNAGAVTFGRGTTGVSGPITAANSLVGTQTNDLVGNSSIRELPNGNYLVVSTAWDNGAVANAGAVTFGSGTAGVPGAVSAANSLVGTHASDFGGGAVVTPLTNGNYVVSTNYWNSGAGAATFGNGTTGVTGPISAANSLVGNAGDEVGFVVVPLANGNYVVPNQLWDNGAATDAGAVAFGNGTTGTVGTFSAANSLIGTTAGDMLGNDSVTALTNGNYVVASSSWDRGGTANAGAVTWGNGTTGTVGPVTAANSLVGTTANDLVGLYTSGPAVTALTNGNYVVVSPRWQNGAAARAGAATLGNGSTGTAGPVTAANSLVGTTAFDQIGSDGVTPLANGNYVVRSHFWTNGAAAGAGAATFGSGTTGVTGPVTAANSLVGTTAADGVGDSTTFSGTPLSRVVALSNGNYVVVTARWDNGAVVDAGAATFGNGTTGVAGPISAANSLVGTTAGDFVYAPVEVTQVGGGNYLVTVPGWDAGGLANVGAVTFGSGATGVKGPISAANSLVGTSANDALGYDANGGVVTVFPNGNFLVR